MLNKNEIKILKRLLENPSFEFTLSDMSKILKQKYPQTYNSIKSLVKMGLVKVNHVGKSKVLRLDFLTYHPEYAIAEIERLINITKDKKLSILLNKVLNVNRHFICILFGSHAFGNSKKSSDIDLLFVVPNEYDISKFERLIKNELSTYNVDVNVITEDSLFEMWAAPAKLNVANEVFKNHIVLVGVDQFVNLVRKRYAGR